jgi:hypothetical protein
MARTKIIPGVLDLNATGADKGLKLPSGDRTNRPTGVAGAIRNNTQESMDGSSSAIEYYNGTDWKFLKGAEPTMDFMIVSGGGQGGGGFYGGGGGAGGLRTSYGSTSGGGADAETGITLSAGTYTVTIGAGATGGGGTGGYYRGFQGNGSSIQPPLATQVTSIGGGGGGGGGGCGTCRNPFDGRAGADGGCGGGGGGGNKSAIYGNAFPAQGYHGGCFAGGGGGTGQVGDFGTSATSDVGAGGSGLAVSITGSSVNYGGGGGAGGNGTFGAGGSGGGGRGGVRFQNNQAAGSANTGGGGGGAGNNTEIGANGGSGIVILRLATSQYSGTTTGSPTITTDGTDTILKYTGSGTYVHS